MHITPQTPCLETTYKAWPGGESGRSSLVSSSGNDGVVICLAPLLANVLAGSQPIRSFVRILGLEKLRVSGGVFLLCCKSSGVTGDTSSSFLRLGEYTGAGESGVCVSSRIFAIDVGLALCGSVFDEPELFRSV